MSRAPIALFVYNRLWHARQTVEALQNNKLARESDLFIFSDAAKSLASSGAVRQVRDYIKTITGFQSVNIVERTQNLGLANSIISGVTQLCSKYGRVIVLEDDMVTSPYFLKYMNDSLERFAGDERVISIHGYVYPVKQTLPEAFFLPGADCWGWATWQRGWNLFNPDGRYLLDELKRRKLLSAFDYDDTHPFSKMLEGQIKGANDSWAVRWYASAFLADKLSLYPGRSMVQNIGNDNSGTHCGDSVDMDVELSELPIDIEHIDVTISQGGRQLFKEYFRQVQTGWLRPRLDRFFSLLKRYK